MEGWISAGSTGMAQGQCLLSLEVGDAPHQSLTQIIFIISPLRSCNLALFWDFSDCSYNLNCSSIGTIQMHIYTHSNAFLLNIMRHCQLLLQTSPKTTSPHQLILQLLEPLNYPASGDTSARNSFKKNYPVFCACKMPFRGWTFATNTEISCHRSVITCFYILSKIHPDPKF